MAAPRAVCGLAVHRQRKNDSMLEAARITDTGQRKAFKGAVRTCAGRTFIGGQLAARVGDELHGWGTTDHIQEGAHNAWIETSRCYGRCLRRPVLRAYIWRAEE
jgi:hypothetical protein